jgi:2-polyprenyl-3-methyl-5-hydroxy-6-metoxy-1,4-benzoquinol methylase
MGKEYDAQVDLDEKNSSQTKLVLMCGHDRKVLDVGCAGGTVTQALKRRGCRVTGIEIDPDAAERARAACDRVIVGDLDAMDLSAELEGEKFDVIIFGDIIEHLKSPAILLAQVRELLAPGGFIGVSVPNIAHASIRLMLLKGEFKYSEMGILDDTHLRFFTRESLCDLLNSCGYVVDSLDYTEVPVSLREIRTALDPLGLGNLEEVVKSFSSPDAQAFQYVAKAFPASEKERLQELVLEKARAEKRARELEQELNVLSDALESAKTIERAHHKLADAYRSLEREASKRADYIEELGQIVGKKDVEIEERDARITELEGALSRTRDEIADLKSELSRVKGRPQ